MSRGSRENARVRREIVLALFTLMKKKNFSEITVSDIIREAHVARASYYRNFDSKEDVIVEYMDQLYKPIMCSGEEPDTNMLFNYEHAVAGFEKALGQFLLNKSQILTLYDNGFASLILDLMNSYIETTAGDMPQNSIERYHLYYISGATFNVLIRWLKEGAMESPHEMARICADFMCEAILKK